MFQPKYQKHQANRNNKLAPGQKYRGGRPVKKPRAPKEEEANPDIKEVIKNLK